jgi:epsilon-lactone hydrolase
MTQEQRATSDKDGGVDLEPRHVDAPATISPAAREVFVRELSLNVPGADDEAAGPVPRSRTTATTYDEWVAAVAEGVDEVMPYVERALAACDVTVTEDTMAGVPVLHVTPSRADPADSRRLLDFHGGAYLFNPGRSGTVIAIWAAERTGLPVTTVDYRMAPEHPFPAAVDDCVTVYAAMLEPGDAASHIGLVGLSAGGALVATTLLRARDEGVALPGAAVLLSPWSDLTAASDSLWTLEDLDPSVPSADGDLDACATLYADTTPREDPLVSPVFADYSADLPPALLITGTRDLLLSDTARLHQRMRAGGQRAELLVSEGMWHSFLYDDFPEARSAWAEVSAFLDRELTRG